jgi:general secretion pathway protein K
LNVQIRSAFRQFGDAVRRRRPRAPARQRGIALLIVMMVVIFLAILAGGFAYSMRVETRLAANTIQEPELIWLGRSGVEMARWILAQQLAIPDEPYDALTQFWAGGSGWTNDIWLGLSLENNRLGAGTFSLHIEDLDRKFNINAADDLILHQALSLMGVDVADASSIVAAIQDWRDLDDRPRVNGAESDEYERLDPPYVCKDGPIDDLSELLLIRGITPNMYWGGVALGSAARPFDVGRSSRFRAPEDLTYPVGFVELFSTVSGRQININTASEWVLQMIPGINENVAALIVSKRAEFPFLNVGELINVGVPPQIAAQLGRYCTVRSTTFEVTVDAQLGQHQRTFKALLRRNSPRDVQVLSFYWY